MTAHPPDMASRLSHVCWIGGPPDSGKSTVAALIAELAGGTAYHLDRHEMDHLRRATPEQFPHNAALFHRVQHLPEAELMEELWLSHPVADMASTSLQTWEERLPLVIDDLLALPSDRPIIAEGPGFFPGVILPLLAQPWQAAWMLPTVDFKRESHARREKTAFRHLTSNPTLALHNHIERDLLLMEAYRHELTSRGLPWIEVTGTQSAEDIARQAMALFRLAPIAA